MATNDKRQKPKAVALHLPDGVMASELLQGKPNLMALNVYDFYNIPRGTTISKTLESGEKIHIEKLYSAPDSESAKESPDGEYVKVSLIPVERQTTKQLYYECLGPDEVKDIGYNTISKWGVIGQFIPSSYPYCCDIMEKYSNGYHDHIFGQEEQVSSEGVLPCLQGAVPTAIMAT